MKAIISLGLLLTAAACVASKTLPLPSYITACSRNEKDINACATKRGREALPSIVKGDKKYKIPVLDPLLIPLLHVDEGILGLNFTATDLVFKGLKNTILNSVIWNPKEKSGVYDLTIPRVDIDSDYVVNGRILILPITGQGRSNITFVNMNIKYVFTFDLVKKKGGATFVIPNKGEMTLNPDRMYVHLDNLFNGNKILGEEMNRFMDEHWKDMVTEMGPVIGQAMGEVMKRIQKNVFELVDYDHAFPDLPVS